MRIRTLFAGLAVAAVLAACATATHTARHAEYPAVNTNHEVMYRVYFDTNKAAISKAGRKTIADAAVAFSHGGKEILLAGHADAVGNSKHNLELSKMRTDAVMKMLVDNGVPKDAIQENYFGERRPLMKGASASADAHNRRVLIIVR